MEMAEWSFMDQFSIYSSPVFLAKILIKVIIPFFLYGISQNQLKSMSKYLTEFRRARLDVELRIRPW